MKPIQPSLEERFQGCLLGLAVGDALGSPLEGMAADMIQQFFGDSEDLFDVPPDRMLHYTDDTQMTIGVAQTLVDQGQIEEDALIERFVANFNPSRGYGGGSIRILRAMSDGMNWRKLTQTLFPGGSYGNGAAMRVAPIGLFFHDDLDQVWEQSRLSALPTHIHRLGIEGAQLLAVAIAWLVRHPQFDAGALYNELGRRATTDEFRRLISTAATMSPDDSVSSLGNGIEAHRSVLTSIACFAPSPDSFEDAVGRAISIGGDTDTLAAMAGALSGTHLGRGGLPGALVERLENGEQGRDHIRELATRLCVRHCERRSAS